ncbi:MAG TPA: hypothetical protein VMV38_01715 [Candidatus Paceibacterota bacterium]|nr:hypothetical protein [Candidatus Paceibacterota bacterium]
MNMTGRVLCSFFLVLFSLSAFASGGTFEVGGGVNRYRSVGNGVWYQKGFPYHLQLHSSVWMLGWQQPITEHLVFHADWLSLGKAASDSWDTPIDANYNASEHRCYGACVSMAHFVGHGSASGLALSLSQHFGQSGWFFVNAGLYVNRVRWEEDVYHWQPLLLVPARDLHVAHRTHWEVAPMVGIGVQFGNFSLVGQYISVQATRDAFPAIFHGADVVLATVRF